MVVHSCSTPCEAESLLITETSPYKSYPRFAPNIIVKTGEIWVDTEMVKSDIFQDFSLKSYVVDIY